MMNNPSGTKRWSSTFKGPFLLLLDAHPELAVDAMTRIMEKVHMGVVRKMDRLDPFSEEQRRGRGICEYHDHDKGIRGAKCKC